MIIKKVIIDKEVKVKIYCKHGVYFREVREALLNNPLVMRTRNERYMALNFAGRHITVIFSFFKGIADIVTAYPSSDWQVKLFKNKR